MNMADLYQVYRQFPSVQTDTRKLKTGDLFFALKGPNFNGNAFAQHALQQGAQFAVIDEAEYNIAGKTILVPDVLKALQALALQHRQQLDIPFLAITGSNGKTTTKELVHAVLATTFKTYTTEGNLNNHIGVPLTILKIREDAQLAVIEMGANHQQEIAGYCTIALPTHGLITNCGKAHLEGFGGVEGVRKGKGELFDALRSSGGTAFIMSDYDYLHPMSEGIKQVIQYGTEKGDVTGTVVQSDPFLSVQFSKGLGGIVNTHLVGAYNLPNVLAAAAVGLYFGVAPQQIVQALESYVPSNSRSQMVRKGSNQVILDAYNANPSSMKLAIENLAKTAGENKVLVLGAMAELGAESLQEHEAIIETIDQYPWKAVALVGGDFKNIPHRHQQFDTAIEAGEWLRSQQFGNSLLLVKGSRSTGMEKVLAYLE